MSDEQNRLDASKSLEQQARNLNLNPMNLTGDQVRRLLDAFQTLTVGVAQLPSALQGEALASGVRGNVQQTLEHIDRILKQGY